MKELFQIELVNALKLLSLSYNAIPMSDASSLLTGRHDTEWNDLLIEGDESVRQLSYLQHLELEDLKANHTSSIDVAKVLDRHVDEYIALISVNQENRSILQNRQAREKTGND